MPSLHTNAKYGSVLLVDLDRNGETALARGLDLAGFFTCVADSVDSAKLAMKATHFIALVVMIDLDDTTALHRLDKLRRYAPRSWMIVVSARCDTQSCHLIYRHGGDACIPSPVSVTELAERLAAFRWRARPLY